jgi:hypothetical protein
VNIPASLLVLAVSVSSNDLQFNFVAVPEPATLALATTGLVAAAGLVMRGGLRPVGGAGRPATARV